MLTVLEIGRCVAHHAFTGRHVHVAFAGFIGFLAWVVIVSILMFVQGSDADDIETAGVVEGTSA